MKTLTFRVDDLDAEAIERAIAWGHANGLMPDTDEPEAEKEIRGRVIGEICRGYLDLVGAWPHGTDKGGEGREGER